MSTVHLLITGKVQGVFYRASAKKIANKLGITGWIKNTEDGNVEATVSGERSVIENFINWCKYGPDRACVAQVTVKELSDIAFNEFVIVR